jgi:hypothetical protein
MKHYIFSLIFVLTAFAVSGQTAGETPETIIDNFFKVYEKEGAKAAVDIIYTYGDSSMQQSKEFVRDTLASTAKSMGGKYLGSEMINKVGASSSLTAYTYLVKFTYAPMRITFIFYKPKDKWMVQHFSFDTNLFSEVYKATRLEPQK